MTTATTLTLAKGYSDRVEEVTFTRMTVDTYHMFHNTHYNNGDFNLRGFVNIPTDTAHLLIATFIADQYVMQ